jgi:hypothetical protein
MTSGQDVNEFLDTLGLVESYFLEFFEKKKFKKKWIVSVHVRTDHPVQPLLYLSISKPYQLSSTDPPVSTVG